ncbi:hypothetical protein LLH03_02680 [bacterium]|nr:hypothetical protein [bacterium]
MSPHQCRDQGRARFARVFSRRSSRALLVLLTAALLLWDAAQVWRLRPGGKAPPQSPNAVMCTHCGWQGWRVTMHLPQRCPHCRQVSLHFAGICPSCRTWTSWELAREELLFARPRLFMDLGPAYFLPKCRKCGAQTTPRGAPAVPAPDGARRPTTDSRSAPRARGERQ